MDDAYRLIATFCQSAAEGRRLLFAERHLVETRTRLGETPLHYLAVENQMEAVKALVEFGAEVNTFNDFGATPLSDAASLGYTELVEYLVSVGAKLGVERQDDPILIRAASSGNLETVQLLLDAGADVNAKNDLDETALHVAAGKNDVQLIRLLVDAGADMNARRIFDETPLLTAEWSGSSLAADELSRIATRACVRFIDHEFDVTELDHELWFSPEEVRVISYWSCQPALTNRHFRVRLLWSREALYVRFHANQREPLNVNGKPDLTGKTICLWDRDVCELFIAPDKSKPHQYFEFEVAPTGEWLDFAIRVTSDGRDTDVNYESGMRTAAVIKADKVVMALKIPWTAFGRAPEAGDIWLGNLFRCVGLGADRGYLAWQPTMTKVPDFHVPERFGEFEFVGKV